MERVDKILFYNGTIEQLKTVQRILFEHGYQWGGTRDRKIREERLENGLEVHIDKKIIWLGRLIKENYKPRYRRFPENESQFIQQIVEATLS